MKSLVLPILLALIGSFPASAASRILGIFPFNGRSHFVMFEQLLKSLARKGHQVDVVSHFPQKKPFPNYNDIVSLEGTLPNMVNNMTMDFVSEHLIEKVLEFIGRDIGNDICKFLEHPKLQELANNPPKDKPYDLVITEIFGCHCYIGFGHVLKVPVVGMSSSVSYPWMSHPYGNPENTAYVPNNFLGFSEYMTFWERVQNTVYSIHNKLMFNYYTSPQDEYVRKYFGPDAPGVRDLERSVALLLVNSHYSVNGIRPWSPSVVEVGGLHVQDDGPELPTNLEMWLDESREGFVFFSLGSLVKIESLPKEMLAAIYTSFARIAPIRVLMKIANKDELPPGLPKNVLTQPWISQFKVLKHKNIRAFMTHGGLMGTQEAVVAGVPLIGVPLFADQTMNINTYVRKNIAVKLNYEDITEEKLTAALDTILKDPSYRIAAKKLSARFLDRPLSVADTATYWVEYVIRNGPAALRSPALDLSWWQIALLDVYGFLLLAVFFVGYLLVIIIKKLFHVTDVERVQESKKIR